MSNLPATQQTYPITEIKEMAHAVAKSGLFGVKTEEQAMALMLIAHAEGLHPAIAARDYHVIQGRPTLKADAMLARFQTAGGTVQWLEYTDKVVSAVFSHPQGGSVTVEWTMAMAVNAQLTKNPTWKQYPRQMLRARTVSEGIRTVFPGVVVGCYTPEEIEDTQPQRPTEPEVVNPTPAKPTGAKTQTQLTEMQAKYFPRIKDGLDYLFGADRARKEEEILSLSTFMGDNGKMVEGVADYRVLDGKRLQVLAHKIEATVKAAKKVAEEEAAAQEKEPAAEVCPQCMVVGGHLDTCPDAAPTEEELPY